VDRDLRNTTFPGDRCNRLLAGKSKKTQLTRRVNLLANDVRNTTNAPEELQAMFESGTYLEISYPVSTHVRHLPEVPRRVRKITVRHARDLVRYPLTVNEFLRRPFVARSRWLISAWDNDIRQFRQFYLGSTDEFFAPGRLRLALYEPDGFVPKQIICREFQPTVVDRRNLIRLVRDWNQADHEGLVLRILADDFRVVS